MLEKSKDGVVQKDQGNVSQEVTSEQFEQWKHYTNRWLGNFRNTGKYMKKS